MSHNSPFYGLAFALAAHPMNLNTETREFHETIDRSNRQRRKRQESGFRVRVFKAQRQAKVVS